MIKLSTKIKYVLAAAVLFVLAAIGTLCNGAINAHAAVSGSNVLDDLRKDSSFDVEKYPIVKSDSSLNVIQIAESTDGELLIYVYQPGAPAFDYKAKSINIAREPDNSINLDFKNYLLTYLNSTGVFYKYKVTGLKINSDAVRYYNISTILRPFDRYLDMNENNNTVSEIPYTVGQYWTVTGKGNDVNYLMTTSEFITIQNKYVGYVNYTDGVNIKWNGTTSGSTDAHFVAFSTDKKIDKLLSVKLTFNEQQIDCKYCCNIAHAVTHGYKTYFDVTKGKTVSKEKIVKYTEKGGNGGGGNIIHADPYAWYRIRTTSEFLADENNKDYTLTKGTSDDVKTTQWVLSFTETQRYSKSNENDVWQIFNPIGALFVGDIDIQYKTVSDVMLLQMEFEKDGKTFKLGIVDNKQTGNPAPGNEPTAGNPLEKFKKTFAVGSVGFIVLLTVVGIIVVLILICIFVPGAAPAIGNGLLNVGKALLWVILLPFRAIAALFRAIGNAIAQRKTAPKTKRRKSKGGKRK